MIIDTREILRHRPPFRFIDFAVLEKSGMVSASVIHNNDKQLWTNDLRLSFLPVEYASQLIGAAIRSSSNKIYTSGVLAGVSQFKWKNLPASIASVSGKLVGERGDFHDFIATFYDFTGTICAEMKGLLHLSDKLIDKKSPSEQFVTPKDGPIYRIIDRRPTIEGVDVEIETIPTCPVYAGHFPNDPVTPGVLIVEMMLEAAQSLYLQPLMLLNLCKLTFNAAMLPNQTATIRIKQLEDFNFSAALLRDGKRLARTKFKLGLISS